MSTSAPIANALLSEVRRLSDRVAALEAAIAGDESLQPTYITFNPATGLAGANFTGLINALGLIIPESAVATLQLPNAIQWNDAGNTAREFIEGQSPIAGLHRLVMSSKPDATDIATIEATASSAGGAGSASVQAVAQDNAVGVQQLANVINSLGQTDFAFGGAQSGSTPFEFQIVGGDVTLTFSGASQETGTVAVTVPWPRSTPTNFAGMIAVSETILALGVIPIVACVNVNASTFDVTAFDPTGSPAAGNMIAYWLAFGW